MKTFALSIALSLLASSAVAQEASPEQTGVATEAETGSKEVGEPETDAATEPETGSEDVREPETYETQDTTESSSDTSTPDEGEKTDKGPAHPLPVRCYDEGDIALTFDDGPGLSTSDILNTLNQNGVKATFHVVKTMLSNEDVIALMKQAISDGHEIGLRFDPAITDAELSGMTLETFKNTLISESNDIHKHLGVFPRLLRMPYEFRNLNHSYHELVSRLGFVVTGWTIDSKDYVEGMSVTDLVDVTYKPMLLVAEESVEDSQPVHESFIVLHRDINDIGPVVKAGIELIKKDGAGALRFVTLGECLHVDNVYKRDVEGLHGYVGPTGEPVQTDSEKGEQDIDPPEYSDYQPEESYLEPEPQPERDEEVKDVTQDLKESTAAGGLVSLMAIFAGVALFA